MMFSHSVKPPKPLANSQVRVFDPSNFMRGALLQPDNTSSSSRDFRKRQIYSSPDNVKMGWYNPTRGGIFTFPASSFFGKKRERVPARDGGVWCVWLKTAEKFFANLNPIFIVSASFNFFSREHCWVSHTSLFSVCRVREGVKLSDARQNRTKLNFIDHDAMSTLPSLLPHTINLNFKSLRHLPMKSRFGWAIFDKRVLQGWQTTGSVLSFSWQRSIWWMK